MSGTEGKETLDLSKGGKKETLHLGLKSSRDGAVARAGAGGRGKSVQVEVRRKRSFAKSASSADSAPADEVKAKVEAPQTVAAPKVKAPPTRSEASARHLSDTERNARARALAGAEVIEADALRREEAVSNDRRREEEVRLSRLQEEENLRLEKEQTEAAALDETKQTETEKASATEAVPEGDANRKTAEGERTRRARSTQVKPAPSGVPERPVAEEERSSARSRSKSERGADARRSNRRLSVHDALNDDSNDRVRSLASVRRQRARARAAAKQHTDRPTKVVRDVTIPDTMTVADLANRMAERGIDVVKFLMRNDIMVTVNQSIDAETAELVVAEFGHNPIRVSEADVEVGMVGAEDLEQDLQPRSPIVTVMGHVDHGKTSLLDALRQTDVVSGEAGGITQHIGAYQVETSAGKISFIDTPGHAAFTAMRQRGARITDIVILVVAADDGVMPQTIEAINHAKAANVPIVVAINKIDRPSADPARVKQELLQHEVVSEDFGGDVQMIEVSALEKTNLDGLMEAVLLQAEILELKANPDRAAEGVVVEAQLDKGRGPVATVLVRRGTLKTGDIFVVGAQFGRVRAMLNDQGEPIDHAGPSVPVEVLGLNGTPFAGDDFVVVDNESQAREISEYRQRSERLRKAAASGRGTLEQMFSRIKEGNVEELPVVIKADVQGTMEAIIAAADGLANDEVRIRILHSGVGAITESDVTLAAASQGLVFGFNVRANNQAQALAKQEGTEVFYYAIIYELIDQLKSMLSGMLAPQINEIVIGGAEVLEVFNISKVGRIAGCRITEGIARSEAHGRLIRDNVVLHDGPLQSLKRFKEDVKEVREGTECGIALRNFQDMRAGDRFELYEKHEVERTL